jgi:hypothetical protein
LNIFELKSIILLTVENEKEFLISETQRIFQNKCSWVGSVIYDFWRD